MAAVRALILDDSSVMRKIVERCLRQAGIELSQVLEASNGEEALGVLQANPVDLVLSDINMPIMDGIEFVRNMQAMATMKQIPVVMITTEGGEKHVMEALSLGAKGLNNIPSLAAQNQLSITQMSLQKTLYALSSGSRINSGADDAAGLAIADGLHANITALTQSARNANDGVGKLQVADGALSQVTTLLNRAVTLATESSTGTLDSAGNQRAALNAEFTAIKAEIDRIGTNTTYNGAAIFQGGSANYNQAVVSDATVGGLGMSTAITGQLLLKGGTGGTAFTFTSSASDGTVGDLINDINTNGAGLIASLDSNGNLVVSDSKNRGVAVASELQNNTSTLKVGGDSTAATVTAAPTNASTMDVYLSDSTGVGSSTISVTLNQFDSGKMNGASIANDDLLSASSAKAALSDINLSIARVASLRGDIGAGINRLQAATSVMSNQTQNLSAAEDGVRSADITQEVANLTKFQILSQTGISALAQANQMQQSVLKLLQ